MAAKIKAVIFDAYGTLLDVHSAMERHAPALGADWQAISQTWRTKQLEYSWVRGLAGQFRDFASLTRDALDFAAAKHGVEDPALLDQVEQAYRALTAYPDVKPVLTQLRAHGVRTAILSNGERRMLDEGVRSAGLDRLLDAVLSVDPVRAFKPDHRVYELATAHFGLAAGEMAFLSSNPWDAFGAHHFGFRVFWVNRTGQPEEYGLLSLTKMLPGLAPLPDAIA
ncbi:MAG: haloacid dehalogenase type II [Janthinobacterium lividum]